MTEDTDSASQCKSVKLPLWNYDNVFYVFDISSKTAF